MSVYLENIPFDMYLYLLFSIICCTIHDRLHLLCVRLLQQRRPELIFVYRMCEQQATIMSGETVVNDNIDPATKAPVPEVKNSGIILNKRLVVPNNLLEKLLVDAKRTNGGQYPAVPCKQNTCLSIKTDSRSLTR